MRILLLCLITSFAFSQDDLFKSALVVDGPTEIQMGKGQAAVVVTFYIQRKDTSKVETWVLMKKSDVVVPPPVVPIKIESESATSIVNASIVGTIIGNMRGDLPGGVVIKYNAVDMTGKTKITFRYSNGYDRIGTMILKIGTTSHTLKFPPTGGWGVYQEIDFPVSGSGGIELTSAEIGSCNYDYFTIK